MKKNAFVLGAVLVVFFFIIGYQVEDRDDLDFGEVTEQSITLKEISQSDKITKTKNGFQATEDATWGDLFRYFDPEGYEALSESEQEELDNTLLTEQSPQWIIKEDGKWLSPWKLKKEE